MNTRQALKLARKKMKEMERKANSNDNQMVVCHEWNEQIEGQLIVVLKDLKEQE